MARNPDHRILYLAPPLSDHEPLRLGEQTGCPERVSERAGHRATGLAMWGAAKRRRKWEAIPERKEGRKERRKEKGSLVWLSDVWQPSKKASLCKGRGAVPPTHWDADPTSPHSSQSRLVLCTPPPVFLPAHIITGHHYHHPLLSVRRVGSGWRVCGDLGGVRSVGDGGGSVSSGEGRNIGDRWMQCV